MIDKNLERIKKKIKKAAGRSNQDPDQIKLIAVTKTVSPEEIRQVVECGVTDIGENRVQDALAKKEVLSGQLKPEVRWHMIGHLQTNKVKQAVKIFDMIQSVDSLRLSLEIDKRAGQIGKVMPILLEVNVSGEESKFGLKPEELLDIARQISKLSHLKIMGLMTMAPLSNNPEELRPLFRRLRELSVEVKECHIPGVEMEYLSMGMSQDYEVAIEEGANMVRIGSAIFKR